MTSHAWYETGRSSAPIRAADESQKVVVHWACDRCGSRTTLYEPFHPADMEPDIVSADPDCDVAAVANVLRW